jgi:hypothetical protein
MGRAREVEDAPVGNGDGSVGAHAGRKWARKRACASSPRGRGEVEKRRRPGGVDAWYTSWQAVVPVAWCARQSAPAWGRLRWRRCRPGGTVCEVECAGARQKNGASAEAVSGGAGGDWGKFRFDLGILG